MLKRTLSGAGFVVVVAGFFLLREFVDARLFQILTCFFMSMATFEVARAVRPFTSKWAFVLATVYGVLFVPVYCLTEYLLFKGMGWLIALDFTVLAILVTTIWSFVTKQTTKTFGVSILPLVYPAIFVLTMLLCNDLVAPKGFLATLLVFVISPFADTFAYLVGMTYSKIRKGNVKKLCPSLSPNKTVAGAIGGIVGGAIGGIIVYFIFRGLADTINFFSPIVFFIIAGFVGSILTELGDLLESLIKRKAGIKDMGKIMPGHGGIMDRIDGISVASAFMFLFFLFV